MNGHVHLSATRGGLLLLLPDIPASDNNIIAAFTTRIALDRAGPGFVNFGFSGAIPGAADARSVLCDDLALPFDRLTVCNQVHGTNVAIVDDALAGSGAADPDTRIPDTDASATCEPLTSLAALTSDCLPVLLYDPAGSCVSAVHAGWRGLVGGILEKSVATLSSAFGAAPDKLHALIGPSIGPCCFEIKEDVADILKPDEAARISKKKDGMFLDLWTLAGDKLRAAGIKAGAVHLSRICTCCRTDLFYSHRGDTGVRGSNLSLIALRGGTGA